MTRACIPMPSMGIVFSLVLAACAPVSKIVPATPTAAQQTCQPSHILTTPNSFPEIQGTMQTAGELWALLFFDQAHARQDLKIVWRVSATGKGPSFQVDAKNENGKTALPIWGPEFHESSSWNRPGEEWGTGFNFPEAGCWTITVTSGATVGEIVLNVIAS